MLAPLFGSLSRDGRVVACSLLAMVLGAPVLVAQSTTWTGALSSAWSDPGNWSNGVPSATTDAVIAAAANAPSTAGATAACRDLVVPAAATLDVAVASPLDVNRSSNVDGTVTGGGKLRFVGASGTIDGDALPDCDVVAGGHVFLGRIVGDLVMAPTAATLRIQGSVTGDATLLGGAVDMLNGLTTFDVDGNLTFQTSQPVTAIPGATHVGGTLTTNANFQPASGTIVFDGASPQVVSMPTATFHALTVAAGSSLTITQPLTTGGNLRCIGTLTATGGAVTVGGDARVDGVSGALTLAGAATLRVQGSLTINGTLTASGSVLDVDGVARFAPGSTTTLGNGVHLFSSGVQFFDALTIPSTAVIALDGATGALDASGSTPLPNVEIRAGDHSLTSQLTISGRLDHLPGAGVLSVGLVTVGGDASIAGAELRTGSNVSFRVGGDLTITTSSPTTATFGTIRVGGDWTSDASWQPSAGIVALAGTGAQTVTMPAFTWYSLTIEQGSTVTLNGPLSVAQDLDVAGTLVVTVGGAQVGDVLRNRATGTVSILGASVLSVGGALTNDGLFDLAQGVLDAGGHARFNGTGSVTLGVGPHLFGAGMQMLGPLVVPSAAEFVFAGAGSIDASSAVPLPNIRIASAAGAYAIGANARIAGDLFQEAGAGALTFGLSVTVDGDVTCRGDSVTTATALSVDFNGDVTIDTPNLSRIRTRVTLAGDLTATATFDSSTGNLVFDGATTQTVTVPALTTIDLRVDATTQLVLNVADLTVSRDLTVAGAFSTPVSSLTVGRDLIVEAGGSLDVGSGNHTVVRNLRNQGAAVTGTGAILLTGTGDLRGPGALGNLVVDSSGGTRSTFGAVTIGGALAVLDGTLSIAGSQTLAVNGDARMSGGTLQGGNANAVLDLNGDAVFDGTAAGAVLPIIRCAGDWASNSTFRPTAGRVELDGSGTTSISGLAPGFDPTFFDLRILNGDREVANDFDLDSPTLSVSSGGGLVVGPRRRVGLRCVGVTIDGRIEVRRGARLSGDANSNIQVNSSGTMRLAGEAGSNAELRGQSGGGWGMVIDGTLDAAFFDLRGMGAAGVRIGAGATIQALHDGVFGDGSAAPGAVLLDIARSAAIDLDDIAFVDTNGTGTFNVRSATTAPIRFRNWSGNFGGAPFEDDPNGVIDWLSAGRTELDGFEARGRIGTIALRFSTTVEIDARQFRILRATDPAGPFTEIAGSPLAAAGSPTGGAAYTLTDAGVAFPTRYHYRLEEERQNGVRRLLATDFARPLPSQTTGGGFFVGSGGFADIAAALAVAPAGATVLVEPGSYQGFTVARSVRIAPLGTGRVQVTGPVVVQALPAGAGDVVLQGLDLLGAPLPLDVSGCRDVVVLDDLTVLASTGGVGVRVTGSPRVAVQACSLTQGASSLLVESLSTVHLSGGAVGVLDVRTGSRVVYVGVVPGSVVPDPTATVQALPGGAPRMEFDSGWPAAKPATIEVSGDPGDLFSVLVSTSKSYTDLSFLGFLDMVLLLNQSVLLTLDSGLVVSGTASMTLLVPDDPAAWGGAVPVQLVVLRPSLGKVRFGNVRDAVFLP